MTWDEETPTEPGWYWCWLFRFGPDHEPFAVRLRPGPDGLRLGNEHELAADLVAKWAGPIRWPDVNTGG